MGREDAPNPLIPQTPQLTQETETTPPPARVGAIRWDAWHGDRGGPGRAVQHALGPAKWRSRLPFFAHINGEDTVRIDGASQDVMDREIDFASRAGIAYWAFVTYPWDDPMSLGLKRYLSSRKRDRIGFCVLIESTRLHDPAFTARQVELTAEPGYVTVSGNRPVVYLGFLSEDGINRQWGDISKFRQTLDTFRASVRAKGREDPYIVIMDFSPVQGKRWRDLLGCQAISSYATNAGAASAPYRDLANHTERFWDACRGTGVPVVPIVMSGWDRRPRVARPVPWEKNQKPGVGIDKFYESPTPAELADHVSHALAWMDRYPKAAETRLAIIYAWNENDEGGWLVPTLDGGTARLDAIARVLRKPSR